MPQRKIQNAFYLRNMCKQLLFPRQLAIRAGGPGGYPANPNFSMSGGCCNKHRNPLIGWRKGT